MNDRAAWAVTRRCVLKAGLAVVLAGCIPAAPVGTPATDTPKERLYTTLGPKARADVGIILPHEHVFVDLRRYDTPGYAQAETADVIALMAPELKRALQAGITVLAEASAVGVGRRADILKAVSEAAGFPLLAPTGVYREPWIPPWVHEASQAKLADWMTGELLGEIGRASCRERV